MLITYHVTCRKNDDIGLLARSIALEQTVEVSDECIHDEFIREEIVGRVEVIEQLEENVYKVVIGYDPAITGYELPQFLNVLFGNISLKKNVRVVDISLPEELMDHFPGPRFGIDGIRKASGVHGRPLAASALKPLGLGADAFAGIAEAFALGGGDILKDDHGLANQKYCPFETRVRAVVKALDRASNRTGRRPIYFPNITGPVDDIERKVEFILGQGVQGILVAPFLLGPDTVRMLAEKYELAIMGHPALTGTYFHDRSHGITPAVLLGMLFRLIGCDISIYPHAGGRFTFTPEECRELNRHLARPLGRIKPAFPCAAGGMTQVRIPEMAESYGEDMMYLIGREILREKDDVRKKTARFLKKIEDCFPEGNKKKVVASSKRPIRRDKSFETTDRVPGFHESSKRSRVYPATGGASSRKTDLLLKFSEGFTWGGRSATAYKGEGGGDFQGVTRYELFGKSGKNTKFDLRYFEIEPGGYSTLERHRHEHVVICARGRGVLTIGGREVRLEPNDIARVPPDQAHQLRNDSIEPFGFYCIVDHERDRPVPVDGIVKR